MSQMLNAHVSLAITVLTQTTSPLHKPSDMVAPFPSCPEIWPGAPLCVCVCVCVCVWGKERVYVCLCVCVCVCVCMGVRVFTCASEWVFALCIFMSGCCPLCVCVCVYGRVHACEPAYIRVCMHSRVLMWKRQRERESDWCTVKVIYQPMSWNPVHIF